MKLRLTTVPATAKNHAIGVDGSPFVVAHVLGHGYPAGKGWSEASENTAREIVDKFNRHDELLGVIKALLTVIDQHISEDENLIDCECIEKINQARAIVRTLL